MAEFTQDQIDALIEEKVNEVKKGLFTEEELTKRVTSEVDKRVESGIQKGLETQRQKWERELSEKAKLSAEELAKKEFEEQLNGVTQKEREINKRANLLDAKDMLSEAQIPKTHYEKFIGMLVSDDVEVTKSNVFNFIEMFNKTKEEIETKVKSENSLIPKPKSGNGDEPVTKETFNKMGYAEKLSFKQSNPTLYKEFMK